MVLTSDLPDDGLLAGDAGTVVHVHRPDEAYEVEFVTLKGETVVVATVLATQLRFVSSSDITHARDRAAN